MYQIASDMGAGIGGGGSEERWEIIKAPGACALL